MRNEYGIPVPSDDDTIIPQPSHDAPTAKERAEAEFEEAVAADIQKDIDEGDSLYDYEFDEAEAEANVFQLNE